MKVIATLVILAAFGFVVLLMTGAQTETTYTRVAVYHYQGLRIKAEEGDIAQAASALKDVLVFWPPKIPHESQAAGVVAAFRDSTVREIITRMRSLSGEDLGSDPEPWLKKYFGENGAQPNQQGGTNGRQPVSSETNSTSAAAASRRSP